MVNPEYEQSNGELIEAFCADEVQFYKSSYSGGNGCVAVAWEETGDAILVADTKNTQLAPHRYSFEEWEVFVKGVKNGQFDRRPGV